MKTTIPSDKARLLRSGIGLRGSDNPNARLTEDEVKAIRKAHRDGCPVKVIQHTYAITHQNVYLILSGKRWAHTQGDLHE